MLRLFRHIRQRLVLEGKGSRYFGYAVGEIVLIVVGILIAIQISNWNEGRLDRLKEVEYLQNLLVEMKEAKAEFNYDNKLYAEGLAALKSLLPEFEDRTATDAEIIKWIQFSISTAIIFSPPSAVVEDLISSGNLRLISSDELRYALNAYWREKERFRDVEDFRIIKLRDQLRPFLYSRMNRFKEAQPPGTVDGLLASQEFENYIFDSDISQKSPLGDVRDSNL